MKVIRIAEIKQLKISAGIAGLPKDKAKQSHKLGTHAVRVVTVYSFIIAHCTYGLIASSMNNNSEPVPCLALPLPSTFGCRRLINRQIYSHGQVDVCGSHIIATKTPDSSEGYIRTGKVLCNKVGAFGLIAVE